MGKSKQKRKSTREPHLSVNSRASRKRAKQDVFHRVIMIYLESKKRVDFYGNMKKIINDAIYVIPWMIEGSLKCEARRHKQKIINNKIQQF